MKKLYNALKKHEPLNEEEAGSVASFIQFLDAFGDNVWTRENVVGHISSSSWVINTEKTKVLMVYHKIYDSYAWPGGHADGDKDLLHVAIKETIEECGIKNVKPLSETFADVMAMYVKPHIKKGKHITSHIHFNVTYILEADEAETLQIAEEENSDVRWIPVEEVLNAVSEDHMKLIYDRLLQKVAKLKKAL